VQIDRAAAKDHVVPDLGRVAGVREPEPLIEGKLKRLAERHPELAELAAR
jgi:hypothetical protein